MKRWTTSCRGERVASRARTTLPRVAMLLSEGLLAAGLLVAGGTNPIRADEPLAQTAPAGPSRDRVAQWIQQLDSDQFVARETATLKLIEAGLPVVKALVEALDGDSLEVTTRGIYVLRELAMSNDLELQEAAQTALEQIAASNAAAAARRADDTLRTLAGIRQERALAELRELGAVVNTSVRQIGFQISEVTSVEIGGSWRGTPLDLRRLKWLSDVQQVTFEGEQVTDACLEHVAGMKGVSSLVIKRTQITENGMAHLRGLESLRELDVKYTPVGDGALAHLQQLKQLGIVKLYGTKMGPEAVAQLSAALPAAEIDYRRGAFLGVACDQPPAPCTVIQVVPNTAAANAGLLEGDVIVEYAGKPVADFEGLKNLIATNSSGESVELKVARGGSELSRLVRAEDRENFGVRQSKPHVLGLELQAVAEGSPAARLGLRGGDIIRRVDQQSVNSLEAFQQALAQLPAGEEAQVDVARDVRVVSKKVVFGEWE